MYTIATRATLMYSMRVGVPVAVVVACLVYAVIGMNASAVGNVRPCQTVTSTSALLTKYASPFDVFGVPGTPLMVALCDETKKVTVRAGTGSSDQLIYAYGYQSVNGTWKKISFSSTQKSGQWLVGSATASFVAKNKSEKGKVLAYMCQNIQGSWKCGCKDRVCAIPAWQLLEYDTGSVRATTTKPPKQKEAVFDESYLPVYGFTTKRFVPNETKNITGVGFGSSTQVHFGDKTTTAVHVLSSSTAQFEVPDISPGVYTAWFTTGTKRSRNITIFIASPNPKPLTILSISPEVLQNGSRVVIRGSGFTPEGNLVQVGSFAFHNLPSSDGTSITLTLRPEKLTNDDIPQEVRAYLSDAMIEGLLKLDTIPTTGKESPMLVQVLNANGISNVFRSKFK